MKYAKLFAFSLSLLALLAAGCSNPFAPKKRPGVDQTPPAPPATTPDILLDNLSRAMNDRDKDLYETLLDPAYWFTETNCLGEVVFENGLETELAIMAGSRDGTKQGIFTKFRTFEYEFSLIARSIELGRDYPKAFPEDVDGHPDEDWVVFRGRVNMLIIDENNDGFRVEQVMNFKMRQGKDGLWRIIRWIDDPLTGGAECGAGQGKLVASGGSSWAGVKAP